MISKEQKQSSESITSDVYSGEQSAHFVERPGGSGGTFLYNVLLSEIRGKGLGAAAVESSGIAGLLLHGGRTAHSKFNLPIRVSEESTCAPQKGTALSECLNGSSLIIRGEDPMAHRRLAECLGRSMRDIRSDGRLYGGVVAVFGGDFRQIPPVVRRGGRAQIVSASLKRSQLWSTMKRRMLTRDARIALGEGEFARYLIRVGDGTADIVDGVDTIELPPDCCKDAAGIADPFGEIDRRVPPDIETRFGDARYLIGGAILAAKNEDADMINSALLKRFPGAEVDLQSADVVLREGDECLYPDEFLNSLDISGIPPRVLRLK